MMYYGYFRSIDTSVDPLGQQYKVEIITDFGDGDGYNYLFNVYSGQQDIPTEGTELTMCARPFVVKYEGEAGNVYKPYKCSTATVRFMMAGLNENLFANSSRRVMVALLKRNNNVVLKNGRYVDTSNGERDCGIRPVSIQTSENDAWWGYTFKDLDRALYTVEWVGFATPNVYNQRYTLTRQEFELECQDALSTLQYCQIVENESYQSFMEFLQAAVKRLGVYTHLYFPTAVYVPDTVLTSSLRRLIFNPQNFYDESEKTYDYLLPILSELMAAIGCTMVAYGDSLYVIQYDAVAAGFNYYYHYELVRASRGYFGLPNEGYYNHVGTALRSYPVTLGKDTFKGVDTNISVEEVYNKMTLTTNEKVPDTLLPDIKDGELMTAKVWVIPPQAWQGTPASRCIGGMLAAMDGKIKNYCWDNSSHTERSYNSFSSPLIANDFMEDFSGSCIVHGARFESTIDGENVTTGKKSGIMLWCHYGSSGTSDHLPLLKLSDTMVRKRADGVALKGDVTFYRGLFPVGMVDDEDDEEFTATNAYMRARVKIVTYSGRTLYFHPTSLNSTEWRPYMWNTYPGYAELPIGNSDNFDKQKFDRARGFQDTNCDGGGLVIPLPDDITGSDEIMTLTVDFYRHNARETNGSQTVCIFISGLSMATVSRSDDELAEEYDTCLSVVFDDNEIVAKNEETARLSSNYLNNSKGYIFQTYLDGIYWQLRNLTNIATGICGSPEVHRLANKYNQYHDAHISVSTTIHYHHGVRPWSRIVWPTQMAGKVFVVDSMELDFEYDEAKITLLDKVVSSNVPEITTKYYDKATGINLGTTEYNPTAGPRGDGWRGYTYPNNTYYDRQEVISNFDTDRDYGTLDESIDKKSEACVKFEPMFTDDGIYAMVAIPTDNVTVEIDENGNLILNQNA